MNTVTWSDWDTGEIVGTFPDSWNDNYMFPDMLCPKCGEVCHYVEGGIDQDEQGNEIMACWWICVTCHIDSEPERL